MPKIRYQTIKFKSQDKIDIIHKANTLIASYQAQGYTLTLRQLYYQFIAKDLFPNSWIDTAYNLANGLDANTKNSEKNYKKLGDIIGDARMGGYMDWEAVEDRTREVDEVSHWETPAAILRACHNSFRVDKWTTQKTRIEVWVEKDAVEGIAKQAAHGMDVPVFSCRGYCSLSSLWESANRLKAHIKNKQKVVLLHLGDHDPSGIDMSRDIADRLNNFIWTDLARDMAETLSEEDRTGKQVSGLVVSAMAQEYDLDEEDVWNQKMIEVKRIALTMAQVEQYNPPPNPAKATDARYKKYQEEHGDDSWELDALEPSVLDELITSSIAGLKDEDLYAEREDEETTHRRNLKTAADHWDNGLAEVVASYKPAKPAVEFKPPKSPAAKKTPKKKGK